MDSKEIKEAFEKQLHLHERFVNDAAKTTQEAAVALKQLANNYLQNDQLGGETESFLLISQVGTANPIQAFNMGADLSAVGTQPSRIYTAGIAVKQIHITGRNQLDGQSDNNAIVIIMIEHKRDENSNWKKLFIAPISENAIISSQLDNNAVPPATFNITLNSFFKSHFYNTIVPCNSKFFRFAMLDRTGAVTSNAVLECAVNLIGK